MNQFFGVGRLAETPAIKRTKNNKEYVEIIIAITRPYKDLDGTYNTDFIRCNLYNDIAKNVVEYCRKGDLIGVKGRLQTENNKLIVVGDKITFLSSNNSTKDDLSEGEI